MAAGLSEITAAAIQHEIPAAAGLKAPGSDPGRVGRNLAALGAGQAFTWLMTLLWTLVVPRVIGPSGLGLIFTAISVTGFLQVTLGAGTGEFVTRQLVVKPGEAQTLVAAATIARLMLAPLFLVAVFAWTLVAHYSTQGNIVIWLSGVATVLFLLAEPLQSVFQAGEEMHYIALSNAFYKASQGLVGIALTLLGFGAIGYAGCWAVMSGLVLVLNIKWLARFLRVRFRTTKRDLLNVVKGSAAFWTAGLFGLVYLWIDTAMLSLMTNPTVVGWYGVPTRLFQTMLFIPTMFATAWLPRFASAYQRSRQELYDIAAKPVALVISLAVPLAALIAVTATTLIPLVYGHAYRQAIPVMIILGICLVPMYMNITLGNVAVAAGLQRRWTYLMVMASIFNPIVNAILIPLTQHRYGNGAIGASIALVATEAAIAVGGVFVVGRNIVGRHAFDRIGRTTLASAGMGLIVYLVRSAGPVLSIVAGVDALVVLLVASGAITPDEQRLILAMGEKLLRRATGPLARLRPRRAAVEGKSAGKVHFARPVPDLDRVSASAAGTVSLRTAATERFEQAETLLQ